MPTVFSHAALAIGLGSALPRDAVPWRLVAGGAVLACLPDLDVAAFAFRVPYAAPWGHRGVAHSLLAGGLAAGLCWVWWMLHRRWHGPPGNRRHPAWAAGFLLLCGLSHGTLDCLTAGGLGIALLAPFSHERLLCPWRPVPAAPIGAGFFSTAGAQVLAIETLVLLLPAGLLAWMARRLLSPRARPGHRG